MKRFLKTVKARVVAMMVCFALAITVLVVSFSYFLIYTYQLRTSLTFTEFNLKLVGQTIGRDLIEVYALANWCSQGANPIARYLASDSDPILTINTFERLREEYRNSRASRYIEGIHNDAGKVPGDAQMQIVGTCGAGSAPRRDRLGYPIYFGFHAGEMKNKQTAGYGKEPPMSIGRVKAFLYGGDYNPDQWPQSCLEEDIRQMKVHHVNTVTLPVFSWARLQPAEDTYDFGWLDAILDTLYANGIHFILATPTAAQPAWMSRKYPEILPVDTHGMRRGHGGRTHFCPNSPRYREFSAAIAGRMAERYKDHPGLLLWHVNNEYATPCFCATCAARFREWLQDKYGTLDALNEKWYTAFWGHTYYDWDEIEPVSARTELIPGTLGGRDGTFFQGMAVDYKRFMSDSLLGCFLNEKEAIKRHTPSVPVTTNIWGIEGPYLDLFAWAKHMDIASWDNYPSNQHKPYQIALKHDIIRGLRGGEPFLLMEQTPNQQNWQPYNALKRPGVMRLLSYQAIAHGSEGVLFFQWRQSRGACEKYHAAMVPHAGHEHTRTGRELSALGEELASLGDGILGTKTRARAAIMMDWPNWWALEYSSGPSVDLRYFPQIEKYYRAFYEMHIPVDIVHPSFDLDRYDIVVAPCLYMVDDATIRKIEDFVRAGGYFFTTFMSGITDEYDLVRLGGYPGAFRRLLGIWVEETDALYPDVKNAMVPADTRIIRNTYGCGLICDVLHAEGARVLAVYQKDFYAGYPCVTENTYGKGKAVYIGSDPEPGLIAELMGYYCRAKGIEPLAVSEKDVEIAVREGGGHRYMFILNHGDEDRVVHLPEDGCRDMLQRKEIKERRMTIEPKGVRILQYKI